MGQLASSVVKTSIEITLDPDPFRYIKVLVVRVPGGVIPADEHVMIIVPETTAVAPPTASTVN